MLDPVELELMARLSAMLYACPGESARELIAMAKDADLDKGAKYLAMKTMLTYSQAQYHLIGLHDAVVDYENLKGEVDLV